MEAFLLALVFLVMVLGKGQGTQKRIKKEQKKRKKPRTNCKLTQKKI